MKLKVMGTMPAIAKTRAEMRPVIEPKSGKTIMHLAYKAEMQYVRKAPEMRLILCSSQDNVYIDEPVLVEYHCGMRCYKHTSHVATSNEHNCVGDFYYTDGTKA